MDGETTRRSGIMTWVSSIRTTMANDPGRQLLEDQIETDGFLFLEDYLESILARTKLDPIIELVKTPARRRNIPNLKGGTGFTLAKPVVTMDLEEIESDKENETPLSKETPRSAFHRALFQSKDENLSIRGKQSNRKAVSPQGPPSEPLSKEKIEDHHDATSTPSIGEEADQVITDGEGVEESVEEKLATAPRSKTSAAGRHVEIPSEHRQRAGSLYSRQELPQTRPATEPSDIVETGGSHHHGSSSVERQSDNESLVENRSTDGRSTKSSRKPKPYPQKTPPTINMEDIMDIEDITQTIIFSTAPVSGQSEQSGPRKMVDKPTSNSAAAVGIVDDIRLQQSPNSSTRGHSTAPHLTNETTTTSVNTKSPLEENPTVQPHVTEFPTIGPPSPLRRSTRMAKESLPATVHVQPLTKFAATRSSWLVKAREAKAMEGTKRQTILSTFSHHTAAGNKRKSGDMLDVERTGLHHNDMGRIQKLTKIAEASPVISEEKEEHPATRYRDETVSIIDDEVRENAASVDGSDGMIDKLKKTVAGFSARAGKSMGKSLGGAAATALAEAMAAAEAKVAERNAAEGRVVPATVSVPHHEAHDTKVATSASTPAVSTSSHRENGQSAAKDKDRRLSVSDLASKLDAKTTKGGRVFHRPHTATVGHRDATTDLSTSTTPPNSPPKAHRPVFTLPGKPKLPPVQTYFAPPPNQTFARVEPQPSGPSRDPQAFHSQSTFYSTQSAFSDAIFDHEIPTWVPSTQDTDFSDHGPAQSSMHNGYATQKERGMSADESWHLDEKFGETWTPVTFTARDDDLTWSTAPTRSTRSADTGNFDGTMPPPPLISNDEDASDAIDPAFGAIPSNNPPNTNTDDDVDDEDMEVDFDEGIASVRLVTPAPQSKSEHYSEWSAAGQADKGTSTNTGGFFSSASKLVSSVLGGSKKGVEPVKSLQLAAVAAKKQQEEVEKKTMRLKEMETRRQQALQKKAEDDKAREEKKAKEENDRWKREREKEDTTDRRLIKQPGKKVEDDPTKKRKIAETDKRLEAKKQPSKDKKDASITKIGKLNHAGQQSAANAIASSSKQPIKHTSSAMTQGPSTKGGNVASDVKTGLGKAKGEMKDTDTAPRQPSQVVHSQMQARYQAQMEDTRKAPVAPTPVRTESIELPDINSEYSDSDDENRVRTFAPPEWAQSPELREALESQKTVNPDDIFGAIRPLKMEELFKNRTSRFRARTSSANWGGTDGLTVDEEMEYARRMGYKQ